MTRLHEPLRIGRREVKNRLVRAGTSERLAGAAGECTDDLVGFLRRLAEHEVGTVITGHAFVEPAGRSHHRQLGIHDDNCIPGLARLAAALHRYDTHAVLQVDHCGLLGHRRVNGRGPLGPAVPPWIDPAATPVHEMTDADCGAVVARFGDAARRALEAGFDGIQLRAGQGYLVHQFLAARTNPRSDAWGGNPSGRARFLQSCLRAMVDTTFGELPIWVQLTVEDGLETGGSPLEEAVAAAQMARDSGALVVEMAAGTADAIDTVLRPVEGPETEAYSAWKSRPFREIEGLLLLATGGVRSPEIVDVLLQGKRLDLVGMSRPFLREPDLARRLLRGQGPRCTSGSRCARERSGLLRCRVDAPPGEREAAGLANPID